MKANTPVNNLIRQAHAVKAEPRLVAEFNWNRYAPVTPTNNPTEAQDARDPDIYPIDSIIRANRPKKGHVKAQLDSTVLLSDYSPTPPAIRYHIAEPEDIYKYWSSPDASAATATPQNTITNLATSPIPSATNISTSGAGYSSTYFGGDSSRSNIAAGADGPVVNGAAMAYVRKTIVTANTTIARMVWQFTGTNTDSTGTTTLPVTAGKRYRVTYYARIKTTNVAPITLGLSLKAYDSAGVTVGTMSTSASVTIPQNTWTRLSFVTSAIPAGATGLAMRTTPTQSGLVTTGDTSEVTGLMITDVTNDITQDAAYFDGSYPDPAGYDYSWTGTANASTSTYSLLSYAFPNNASSTLGHGCNPSVSYGQLVNTNKIVIGVESSSVQPMYYTIHVQTTVGGSWTQIADQSNTSLDSDGRIILYRSGATWGTTRDLTGITTIAGVQIRVSHMRQPSVYFQLIEIAARLEKDITDWTIGLADQFDLGDSNVLSPVGKISSNTGSLTLFNGLVDEYDYTKGLIFNQSNTNSPFYGLMNENVKFTLDYLFDASAYGGSSAEVVRQLTMFADSSWDADLQETVSVSVRDASKYLQETKCPETFYTIRGRMTIGEIIWRLLDNIGFLDYNIDNPDISTPLSMEYFWVTPDKYVWDILNELAEATQTAIYFDSYGVLQVKTKEAAFNSSATPVWTLRGQTSGVELEDIYQDGLTSERKDISNSMKITYRPVDYERTANDNIVSQLVWEPETETVILRSSDIVANCPIGQMTITIGSKDATDWPYTGMLQVEGEVMEYDGKQYRYIDDTAGGVTKYAKVTSLDDYQKYYWKTNANNQYLNGFTGALYLKTRGMWNTYEANHMLGTYNYTVKSVKGSSVYKTLYGYYYAKKHTKSAARTNTATGFMDQSSYVRLQSTTIFKTDQYLYATRGSTAGDAPNFYGTSFRIPGASQKNYCGGLVINSASANGAGYHIEVRPTAYTTKNDKEIVVYMKDSTGKRTRMNGKGWRANIVKNVYYSLDVQFSRGDSVSDGGLGNATHYIWVWLNGRLLGRASIGGSGRRQNSDNFGMYLRGSSAMDYEYLYAYERKEVTTDQFWGDDVSFYDRVINGYVSNQSLNEFTSKSRTARRRVKGKTQRFTQRYDTKFFDEFGPVCHEMRKFDVKFDGLLPGLAPKLIATNYATAKYIDFRATAFGAQFYAVNSSHNDTNIHGTLDEVDQSIAVAMQSLQQTDGDVVTVEDSESIRVNGKKELEIESDWIQSKEQATAIGEWIKGHWDSATDEISVTIFGNPLIELTDVVYVNDPQSQRVNEKYFVIATATDWDNGLQTILRLRKVRV